MSGQNAKVQKHTSYISALHAYFSYFIHLKTTAEKYLPEIQCAPNFIFRPTTQCFHSGQPLEIMGGLYSLLIGIPPPWVPRGEQKLGSMLLRTVSVQNEYNSGIG